MEKSHGGSGAAKYDQVELKDGRRVAMADAADDTWVLANGARLFRKDTLTSQRPLGSLPVSFKGRIFTPEPNYWKTGPEGFERQIDANLLVPEGSRLAYVRFLDDFPQITNVWADLGGIQSRSDLKIYVVQTNAEVVKRAVLMTTCATESRRRFGSPWVSIASIASRLAPKIGRRSWLI